MLFDRGPQVALLFFAVLLLAGAVRVIFAFWRVAHDARTEWPTFRELQPTCATRVSESDFRKAYVKAHGPHGLAMALVAILLAALITPLAMMALTFIYHKFVVIPDTANLPAPENMAEEFRRQLRRDGPLVRAFFLFFGLLASWSAVAFFLAALYHRWVGEGKDSEWRAIRGLDGSMNQGDADAPAWRKKKRRARPSWSPLIETDEGELALPEDYEKGE